MQRDAGALDAAFFQLRQHRLIEVQRGGGRGHCAGGGGKHGLIAFAVLSLVRIVAGVLVAFDIGGQRQMAVALHQLIRCLAVGAFERHMKQRAVFVGPAAQQHGIEAAVLESAAQMHAATDEGLLAHAHVGDDLVVLQHAFDEQFQLAAAFLLAEQARLEHAGVVEDQQIARLQQVGQFAEDTVCGRSFAAIEQPRGAAHAGRVLCNQGFGKFEIEVAQVEFAARCRCACFNAWAADEGM
ncbi:hypothetical protein SDC9_113408 [bioreactor metagenome]|uniref:Uncharacterized protein n=1 Tax=bioreactor metagenome TaxID=1076179 RepID=A0A645BLZ0_9ZZZZ